MRVLICSYPAVSMPGGGVRTVIMKTQEYLTSLGVSVSLFDQWRRYDWSEVDLIHLFASDHRNHFLLKALPANKPLVISPIIDKSYSLRLVRLLYALSQALPHQVLTSFNAYRLAFSRASVIVANSPDERQTLQKGFGVHPDRISEIPYGVEGRFLDAEPDRFVRKYGLQGFVLYVGQIGNPRKNLHRLLHVVGRLPRTEFVFIGPILETREARQIIQLSRQYENLHVLGALPRDELASAYGACKVLALPSLTEGAGIAALEAGLAGAKVVITCHGGPPHYLGDLAEYVDPRSEKSIARGLEAALAKPRDGRLRERIRSRYLWDHVARRLKALYERVLEQRLAPRTGSSVLL